MSRTRTSAIGQVDGHPFSVEEGLRRGGRPRHDVAQIDAGRGPAQRRPLRRDQILEVTHQPAHLFGSVTGGGEVLRVRGDRPVSEGLESSAHILETIDALADEDGTVPLQAVVETAQARLASHPLFPGGRLTNYVRFVKVDLEARGEVERVPASSPQRIRRAG